MNNQPSDAILLFISALYADPNNEKIYMMLGISYPQIKKYIKTIETFQERARKAVIGGIYSTLIQEIFTLLWMMPMVAYNRNR